MGIESCVLTLVLSAPSLAAPTGESTAGFQEATKLTAAAGGTGDQFGRSVAIDGDTIVVGALPPGGAAHVFQRTGAGWGSLTEIATLTPSDPQAHDGFGEVVAIRGETIVVGAELTDSNLNPGAAYVFVKPATGWTSATETAKLTPSDPGLLDGFGLAVEVSGDTVVVGAPQTIAPPPNNRGAIYVFEKPLTGWVSTTETAKLTIPAPEVRLLGHAVAMDDDTLIAGAPGTSIGSSPKQGAAYVFVKPTSGWSGLPATLRLTASDGAADDRLGSSIDIAEGTIVAGALGAGVGENQGAAYLFVKPPSGWASSTETAKLTASDGERLGYSSAISGDTLVAGSANADIGGNQDQGAAYVFVKPGSGWVDATETSKLSASDGAAKDSLGEAVAIDGPAIVAGARYADIAGQLNQGATYLFEAACAGFVSYCTAGTSASGCQALISGSGIPSASATSGLVLTTSGVEGGKDGLHFFGTSGRQANPWGNGTSLQCVLPPVRRAGLLTGTGTPGLCDGSFSQDLNALWCPSCPQPLKNPGAGSVVQAQLWYRDPQNTSNQSTSLSDAIEFCVGP